MISFSCDYMEGCAPEILKAFQQANFEQLIGYGDDVYCEKAKEKIRKAIKAPKAEIYFLVGGTQTNRCVLSSLLDAYEGVVAATTGHIAGHEAGAIENSGHKVLTVPAVNGKIAPQELRKFFDAFNAEDKKPHIVHPGAVYISYPTEYGTLYTKKELKEIHGICKKEGVPLYIDGARLGYGLSSEACDVTFPEFAKLCDVFYIGGTKCGAWLGEAVVFPKGHAPKHFFNRMKQTGCVLAKGWVAGLAFATLFTDNLYFKICAHANAEAQRIKKALGRLGVKPYIDSPTNQQFFAFDNTFIEKLGKKVGFGYWEPVDKKRSVIRFATSWATLSKNVDELIAIFKALKNK